LFPRCPLKQLLFDTRQVLSHYSRNSSWFSILGICHGSIPSILLVPTDLCISILLFSFVSFVLSNGYLFVVLRISNPKVLSFCCFPGVFTLFPQNFMLSFRYLNVCFLLF
jgi:hypothetical protein